MTRLRRAGRLGATALVVGLLVSAAPAVAHAGGPASGVVAASRDQCVASTRISQTPPALDQLQSASAWTFTRGAGVTVAVVDSGVAPNPHLDDAIVAGVNLVPDGTDGIGRTDVYGHGTVIAGQIAARVIPKSGVQGLAPEVRILPVRVYAGDSDQLVEAGFGPNTARMAEGIRIAADRGAQIINVSMSTTEKNAALGEAVAYARDRGSLVVASAGNRDSTAAVEDDDTDGVRYPAGFPGAVGVAATDTSGVVTNASIRGSHVALAAPGQDIASAWPQGGDCAVATDGPATSYAAAYVSAAAALVAAAHPDETPAQWAYRLEATAVRPQPDTRSNASGWGVVQPYDAIVLVPGAGLRGPSSPFPGATATPAPTGTPAPVAVVVGPGPDAEAITLATGIGVAGLVVLAAIGALAILVSRRREDDAPPRPAPTGRGLYGDDRGM
ncbi:S8 family serine peptidase [Microbacterium trichothecenolyticum]|uniref:Membrane-anchored mycosin MYCP n=1 Tax=Microbacterium trichothecenolyticum TaxID=69370 RepID=A0ABU0TVA5_MICTR|nr:S8 family serine peptidase [Microbacterium trichothecenolyticum]MDQ1123588.1 membrane-anchored mycosin MYCP [Microbacterium trichothecenolyticum]